jgi:protoporphyrinogen oxidase
MAGARLEAEYLIAGAGLAGLSVASALGSDCIVLEREARPGGLVQSIERNGFWFDRVLHLLYFPDKETEAFVMSFAADVLHPCPPVAWVETAAGCTRYPIQMNLGGLPTETIVECLRDLAKTAFGPPCAAPADLRERFETTFGTALCELFFFPYNHKMWARPLEEMSASALAWTITRPDFDLVLRAALAGPGSFQPYNAQGWYPRPVASAKRRAMGVLVDCLAVEARDLRLSHELVAADPLRKEASVITLEGPRMFRYRSKFVSTLPLPRLLQLCKGVPDRILRLTAKMLANRVWSVAICLRGPRPRRQEHWRYFAQPDLCFTRMTFMHEFDPLAAPAWGWSLLGEFTEPAEAPLRDSKHIALRVLADVRKTELIPGDCEILDCFAWISDPAYVVFSDGLKEIVDEAAEWLRSRDVEIVGRYGRWEYSSMAQVIRDGLGLGRELARTEGNIP